MHEIAKQAKYVMVTDGMGLVHGPIENAANQVTTTGMACLIAHDDLDTLLDMFYESWSMITEEDVKALKETEDPPENIPEVGTLVVGAYNQTLWCVGYDRPTAEAICAMVNSISQDVQISPTKHPERNEWGIPYHERILSVMSEGDAKQHIAQLYIQAESAGNVLTSDGMITERWK